MQYWIHMNSYRMTVQHFARNKSVSQHLIRNLIKKSPLHITCSILGRKREVRGEATTLIRRDGGGKHHLRKKLPKSARLKPTRALLSSPFSRVTGGSTCSKTVHGQLKYGITATVLFPFCSQTCDNLELQRRYPHLHAPLSLFHVQLCWPESFPPSQPLPLTAPCHFHIGSQQFKAEPTASPHSTDGSIFSVKVAFSALHDVHLKPGLHPRTVSDEVVVAVSQNV